MMEERNDFLGEAFIETVQIQINENNPPIVRETCDRLKKMGYDESDAKRIIATVLATESLEMMKNKRTFDADRYARLLKKLPEMPWD